MRPSACVSHGSPQAEELKSSSSLAASDRDRLVACLLKKDATLLRKKFLIVLCRMWRYRSSIW